MDAALAQLRSGWGDCPVAEPRRDVSTAARDRTRQRFDAGDLRPREGEIAEVRWAVDHPDEVRCPRVADYPL